MASDINKKTPYTVMLSSTYKELAEHREAVRGAMLGQRLLPIAMEDDAALPDKDLISASLSKVDEADAYVGLISYRYGQNPYDAERNPEQLSLTELEFRRAIQRKIPICMFIMHSDHPVPRSAVGAERGTEDQYQAFVKLAKTDRIYAEFKSVDDLKAKAVQSLVELRKVLETSRVPKTQREDASGHLISNIAISIPRHFLGRENDLAAIDAALDGDVGRVAITALHGLRGVGKTTLAAAYAEQRRAEYRAIWWIRAETEATIRADLVGLGVQLGWIAADALEEQAVVAVLDRLVRDGRGMLMIYDNATSPPELRKYLPRGPGPRIVVTSNAPNWGAIATLVEIEVWPREIGADFLTARTGRTAERKAAAALSESLGGLPLAHEQAAAYCERVGITLSDYDNRFETAPAILLDGAVDASREYHDGRTVAKTFALAIEEATKRHPAAGSLIVYAALLAPEPIPLYLFSEAQEQFDEPFASLIEGRGLDEAIAALRAFALVDRDTVPDERDPSLKTDCIRLHRLVRQVAAARCDADNQTNLRRQLIEAMASTFRGGVHRDPVTWPRARRLDAIALALFEKHAALPIGVEAAAIFILNQLAAYRQGALAENAAARQLLEHALAICEKALGPDHRETATNLNNLGVLLRAQGDLVGAQTYHERALAIREKLDPNHPDTATSLNNLGVLLRVQGDLGGARPYYERALAISEEVLGPEHPDTAISLNNLGFLLRAQGALAGAWPYYERALSIREKVLGPEHPDTAISLNGLGGLLQEQGDLARAQPYFERALAIRAKTLGSDHPTTARSLNNLGGLLQAQGDLVRARSYYEQALAIREKVLGSDHPDTGVSLNNLGGLLQAQGDNAGARTYYERALAICEGKLGLTHPQTQGVAQNMAKLLDRLGHANGAKALRRKFRLSAKKDS